ncbi:MAG: 23S rRNA (guanine745-N1)-methyltransferase [Porticoccus sp.]|jgi:23S rRNA (guanine745-N1)-methyltransferase
MTTKNCISIWACPVCQAPLKQSIGSECGHTARKEWHCENSHGFDIAKEGYTNLLLAHQKNSSDPGDTKTMVASRRAFLSSGHYQPLADKLTEMLNLHLKQAASVLDSGCGEGYYLQQLLHQRSDLNLFGIDISRDAAKLASRELKESRFAVASSFNLPVLTSSVDAILRVFAPGDDGEVTRVLKPNGVLVVVSPGPRHLFSLKELIYKEAQKHSPPHQPKGFELLDEQQVIYQLEIQGNSAVKQLLSMTPLYWKGNRVAKIKLDEAESLSTEVDFLARVYTPMKKTPHQDPEQTPVNHDVWGQAKIKK